MAEFLTMRVPSVAPLREDNRRANALSRDPGTVSVPRSDPSAWQDVVVNGVVVGVRNLNTGQVIANRYIVDLRNRERRLENDRREEEEESNRGTRGGRGSRGGNGGGAGGGLVQASGPSGGAGNDNVTASSGRLDALNQLIASGIDGLVDGAGLLTSDAQAALVEGLNLGEISDGLISLLDPENYIQFEVVQEEGKTFYTNAKLLTPAELEQEQNNSALTMNFPTAYQYFESGHPIARSSWSGEAGVTPTRWLVRMGGVDWDVESTGQSLFQVGESATLTRGDYFAEDWILVPGCPANLPERAPFPVEVGDTDVPLIDVFRPPCRVAA